jgi:hypothetical protein
LSEAFVCFVPFVVVIREGKSRHVRKRRAKRVG